MQEVDQKLSSEKTSDRAELLQLCAGLRFVRLPCTTAAQVQPVPFSFFCVISTKQ